MKCTIFEDSYFAEFYNLCIYACKYQEIKII